MGSFYVNLTARSDDPQSVARALGKRAALVTPAQHGCVVVADEQADAQDQTMIRSLASALSSRLSCPVFAVLNHDDDILWYCLATAGDIVDEYDSSPGYFDPNAEPLPPVGGNAKLLCAAFGNSASDSVEAILRKSSFEEDGYVFADERHADLIAALGISSFAVGFGYTYASAGDLPEGLTEDRLVSVR